MMILGGKILNTTDEIAEYIAGEPSLGYLRHAILKAIVRRAIPVTFMHDYKWVRDALKRIGYDIDK